MPRPSTALELLGFGAIAASAWLLSPIFGLFVAGCALLLMGYAFDDNQAVVALHRVTEPVKARRAARKERRATKRAARKQPARATA